MENENLTEEIMNHYEGFRLGVVRGVRLSCFDVLILEHLKNVL